MCSDMMDGKRIVVRIFRARGLGQLAHKFYSLKLAGAIFILFSWLVSWLNSVLSKSSLSQIQFGVL